MNSFFVSRHVYIIGLVAIDTTCARSSFWWSINHQLYMIGWRENQNVFLLFYITHHYYNTPVQPNTERARFICSVENSTPISGAGEATRMVHGRMKDERGCCVRVMKRARGSCVQCVRCDNQTQSVSIETVLSPVRFRNRFLMLNYLNIILFLREWQWVRLQFHSVRPNS